MEKEQSKGAGKPFSALRERFTKVVSGMAPKGKAQKEKAAGEASAKAPDKTEHPH